MNRILLILLIILLLVAGYYIFIRDGGVMMDLSDREFAVENTEKIQRVFIAHRDGDTFLLERDGNGWTVNGKYKVFPNAMRNLMEALGKMEIEYIPANAAIPSIVKDMSSIGCKVEVYDRSGERIRNFYIGGTDPGGRSTYMIVEGKEQPYAMFIPYWEGNLRERFLLKMNDWRDRTIFQEDPEDIKKVTISYPRSASSGFVLEQKGNRNYTLRRTVGLDQSENRKLSTGAVERFLFSFDRIGAESIDNDNPNQNEVRQFVPFCTLIFERTDNSVDSLSFWPYNFNEEKIDFSEDFMSKGPFRYFADRNGDDFLLMQQPVLKDILVTYDYFFEIPRDQ
jgi:hypothetical protein